jgi:GxxExxY protein
METEQINELTHCSIGCAMQVSNALGTGFLEKVYENALVIELRKQNLEVVQQKLLTVYYDGQVVGEFCADLVVNGCVLLELKAAKAIDPAHQAQLLNYLKATNLKIGLIINFGAPRLAVKRMVL